MNNMPPYQPGVPNHQPMTDLARAARSVSIGDVFGGALLFLILGIAGCEPEYAPASFVSLEDRYQSGDAR